MDRPGVVILHHGDPALTQRLREDLLRRDADWADRIHVLDNGAPHPAENAWVRLPENRFWAGALAWCLDEAKRLGWRHLWFLNNDIRLETKGSFLDLAWKRLRKLEAASGQAVAIYSPSVLRHPYFPCMVQDPAMQIRRAAVLDGVAPLLHLPSLRRLTPPGSGPSGEAAAPLSVLLDWEDNPRGYGVDVWLSVRLHRAGLPLVVDHGVLIRHDFHTTARQDPTFLPLAADWEDAYQRARLGPDWKVVIRHLARHHADSRRMTLPELE